MLVQYSLLNYSLIQISPVFTCTPFLQGVLYTGISLHVYICVTTTMIRIQKASITTMEETP